MTPRDLWLRFETYHDVTYFTPESRAVTDALGCKGGWMGYFGMRAAPLGEAAPQTVTAAFFSFHPRKVERALPDAWHVAPARRFLQARLEGVDGALRRMLGDVTVPAELVEIAVAAASAIPLAGRPLGAANQALPLPDEPHLALWQACTTLREHRGDGHIAALVAADLDPCQTLVLFGADKGLDPAYLKIARGWSDDEWRAAVRALTHRGLYSEGVLTPAGHALRADIEARTDAAAAHPWSAVGDDATRRFLDLMTPIARRLGVANDAMRVNPMGIDPVRELPG
ncbi:SCO6745 family protein [Saccharothrix violaceirubra]|uniref:SalK n=1 Tax=Saccharothrix violaceirubra TaxID=413306 RepID=A0A7W7WTY8_9PSEU|nr:hypothetical protein [Saccharothrix violaceirubra]MBB4963649.1 hypothetical protein [Saccharothrix violaceirubra]